MARAARTRQTRLVRSGKETALSPTDESSGLDKELLAIHNFTQGLYSANAWFLDPGPEQKFRQNLG